MKRVQNAGLVTTSCRWPTKSGSICHRGYLVAVNYSDDRRLSTITAIVPLREITLIATDRRRPVPIEGSTGKVPIGPFEGMVFEWKQ